MGFLRDDLTGEEIDDCGLPRDMISCPGCGRTYKQQRTVCKACEECKKCCTCKTPNFVTAQEMIDYIMREIT